MIKHFRESLLIRLAREIIGDQWFDAKRFKGSGKGGALVESLLGITPNNVSAADAVEFEIKTKLSRKTLITLFHRNPPRVPGSINALVRNFGWRPKGKKRYPPGTISFRHTIFGETKRGFSFAVNGERLTLRFNPKAVAPRNHQWLADIQKRGGGVLSPAPFWEKNDLILIAARKMGNLLFLEGEKRGDQVRFSSAVVYRQLKLDIFWRYLCERKIAVDFDAFTRGSGLRDHGPKFRIHLRYLPDLYEECEQITQ